MDERKEKIILTARRLFVNYGIRNVTMDEIAVETGMSKKTIYQIISDKKELIREVMHYEMDLLQQSIMQIINDDSLNPIDKNIKINGLIIRMAKNYPSQVERDLNRFYPDIAEELRKNMMDRMFRSIVENLKKGIAAGYYRSDINPEIIAGLQMTRSAYIKQKDNNPYLASFSVEQILKEILKYHLYGICSSKGLEYLKTINFDEI